MRFLILGFLAAALAAAPAGAQQRPESSPRRDVTVRNESRQPIVQLFASRSATERWGQDRLHGNTIASGQSWPLRLAGGGDCSFDFQAAYQDGRVEEQRQVDICHNSVIAFDGTRARMPEQQQGQGQGPGPSQGQTQGRPPQGESHTMIVVNGTQREIVSIYASPTNQTEWGDDRLGDDKLPTGQRFNFDVFGGCKQDLRVVFDNKSAEERRELDICGQNIVNVHPGWTTEESAGAGGGGGGGGGEAPNGGGDHNRIRYLEPTQ